MECSEHPSLLPPINSVLLIVLGAILESFRLQVVSPVCYIGLSLLIYRHIKLTLTPKELTSHSLPW